MKALHFLFFHLAGVILLIIWGISSVFFFSSLPLPFLAPDPNIIWPLAMHVLLLPIAAGCSILFAINPRKPKSRWVYSSAIGMVILWLIVYHGHIENEEAIVLRHLGFLLSISLTFIQARLLIKSWF